MLEDRAHLDLDGHVGCVGQAERVAVLGPEPQQEVQALVPRDVEELVGPLVRHLLDDVQPLDQARDRGHVGAERDEHPGPDEVGELGRRGRRT